MPKSFVVATYSDAETLVSAVRAVRQQNFRVYDVYAPIPSTGWMRPWAYAGRACRGSHLWWAYGPYLCAYTSVLYHGTGLAVERWRKNRTIPRWLFSYLF